MKTNDSFLEDVSRPKEATQQLLYVVPSVAKKEENLIWCERDDFQQVNYKKLANSVDCQTLLDTSRNIVRSDCKSKFNRGLVTCVDLHEDVFIYDDKHGNFGQRNRVKNGNKNMFFMTASPEPFEKNIQQADTQNISLISNNVSGVSLSKDVGCGVSTPPSASPLSFSQLNTLTSPDCLDRSKCTCGSTCKLPHFTEIGRRASKLESERIWPLKPETLAISASHDTRVQSVSCTPSMLSRPKRTFWINVWPCFSTFTSLVCKPTRITVRWDYCYMEQVTEKAGEVMGCCPAPCVLYKPDGRVVRSIKGLAPERHYLLFPNGGFYRKEAVPTALLEELVKAAELVVFRRSGFRDS